MARQYGGGGGEMSVMSKADVVYAAGELQDFSVDRSVAGSVMGSHLGEFVEGSRCARFTSLLALLAVLYVEGEELLGFT